MSMLTSKKTTINAWAIAAVLAAMLIGCAIGAGLAYLVFGDKMIVAIQTAINCEPGYVWYTVAGKSWCVWVHAK